MHGEQFSFYAERRDYPSTREPDPDNAGGGIAIFIYSKSDFPYFKPIN